MSERDDAGLRYAAFLSYSHKDAAAAGRLHRRLETYRLPGRLIGTETIRGPVPARLWPIFRDREELPAATDLTETVREALAQSGALIVLCSPHAAASLWVAEEIRVFRELHPGRPILAAILESDPPGCFPEALRAFGQDGTWHEPLATDLRRDRDGAHLGLLKLVAGITGVGLDALVQRDASRRVRRITALIAVAAVAMLVMAAMTWFALDARREAERQRAEAEGLIEFMLTDLHTRLRGVGRLEIMDVTYQRALTYYRNQERASGRAADSAMHARVLLRIGEVALDRGEQQAALTRFRQGYRMTSALILRLQDDPNIIFAHAQSEYWIGFVGYLEGDPGAAKQAWRRYAILADRLLAIDGNNPLWLREAGYAQGNLCALAMAPPVDAPAALDYCSVALARMRRVERLQGRDAALDLDLVNRHGWMVNVLSANGRWREALAHRATHERLMQSLMRSDPENHDYLDMWMRSQFGFGEQLVARGEHAEARRRFESAARIAAILIGRDGTNATWQNWRRRIAEKM